jgi:glycosyltransferase involved in cell wall biosynthesis
MTSRPPEGACDPLRIQMALPTLVRAGMEALVTQLAIRLHRRGHTVGVTCTEALGPFADLLAEQGISVNLTPCPGILTMLHAPGLSKSWSSPGIDIVHVHNGVWLKGARAARAARVPTVVNTCHGLEDPEPWYDPMLMRLAARSTDRVVAVSAALSRYLVDEVRLPARLVEVITNGVDTDVFRPAPPDYQLRRQLGISPTTFLVGMVARLSYIKNPTLLVQALALADMGLRDMSIIFIGAGDLRESIVQCAAGHGLATRVHFAGEIADMSSAYRELDALALTSWNEGTPMCLLEAMASGVPVLATAVGGVPALLQDGRLGWLVPPGDPQKLAYAMKQVALEPELAAAKAGCARDATFAEYSIDSAVDRYESLYRSARNFPSQQAS